MSPFHAARAIVPWVFAGAAALAAPALQAAGAACTDSAFATGRCALYVDASGSAGLAASLGPETRGGTSFPVELGGSYEALGASSRFELIGTATFGSLSQTVAVTAGTTGVALAPNVAAVANLNLYFSDRLTFLSASTPFGTLGTARGRVAVTGGVGTSPATYPATEARATAQVVTNGASVSVSAFGDRAGTGGIPGIIEMTLPVRFNHVDFTALNVQLGTGLLASALNVSGSIYAAAANANFATGVEWLGIDMVRDANGNLVSDWQVQSGSGFNYALSYSVQAVPEPSAALLLLLGLPWVLRVGSRTGASAPAARAAV